MRMLHLALLVFAALFLLPTLATAAWWVALDRPQSWREARWTSSGILPPADRVEGPAVYVLAARTGGLKGAVSVHSWIVVKRPDGNAYERFDKVGWGSPIRVNGWAADGNWYSNRPWIVAAATGDEAGPIVGKVLASVERYRFNVHGSYRIWPGPNSNSFVAHVLREVPELDAVLPPHAVGRDYAPGLASLHIAEDWREIHATIGGYAGFSIGARAGVEVHLFGLVAGIDLARPGLKIPAVGTIGLFPDQRPQEATGLAGSTG